MERAKGFEPSTPTLARFGSGIGATLPTIPIIDRGPVFHVFSACRCLPQVDKNSSDLLPSGSAVVPRDYAGDPTQIGGTRCQSSLSGPSQTSNPRPTERSLPGTAS